jgi:hypothetical protein
MDEKLLPVRPCNPSDAAALRFRRPDSSLASDKGQIFGLSTFRHAHPMIFKPCDVRPCCRVPSHRGDDTPSQIEIQTAMR